MLPFYSSGVVGKKCTIVLTRCLLSHAYIIFETSFHWGAYIALKGSLR